MRTDFVQFPAEMNHILHRGVVPAAPANTNIRTYVSCLCTCTGSWLAGWQSRKHRMIFAKIAADLSEHMAPAGRGHTHTLRGSIGNSWVFPVQIEPRCGQNELASRRMQTHVWTEMESTFSAVGPQKCVCNFRLTADQRLLINVSNMKHS